MYAISCKHSQLWACQPEQTIVRWFRDFKQKVRQLCGAAVSAAGPGGVSPPKLSPGGPPGEPAAVTAAPQVEDDNL